MCRICLAAFFVTSLDGVWWCLAGEREERRINSVCNWLHCTPASDVPLTMWVWELMFQGWELSFLLKLLSDEYPYISSGARLVEKRFIRPTSFLGKTCFQRHKFFKSKTGLKKSLCVCLLQHGQLVDIISFYKFFMLIASHHHCCYTTVKVSKTLCSSSEGKP